jgi:hypothetical protein
VLAGRALPRPYCNWSGSDSDILKINNFKFYYFNLAI